MPHHSLTHRHAPREERIASGKAARRTTLRDWHSAWTTPADRPDVLAWALATNEGRLPDFVQYRTQRMVESPFAFFRGAADLMAIDLVDSPTSGLLTTAIGDAHLSNFGFYASRERQLVMDVNDFDQAQPGPWEWDLKRLAASLVVAGRGNGVSDTISRRCVVQSVRRYAAAMAAAAASGHMAFYNEVFTVTDLQRQLKRTSLAREIELAEKKARSRTQEASVPKFTEPAGSGRFRIIDAPPRLVDVTPQTAQSVGVTQEAIVAGLDDYVATLSYDWQRVLQAYSVEDVAYRVTGVGSAGLRTYLALLIGDGPQDSFFLQVKEAGPSVLRGRAGGPPGRYRHNGEPVVQYQRRSQTVSDPLLGWTTIEGREYYVRRLRDMKGEIPIEELDAKELPIYGELCATLLARAHARAGDAAAISGYCGRGGELDNAIADFALAYADQNQRDWAAMRDAAEAGALPHPS